MLAEYKAMVTRPGRYEGEHPMVAYIDYGRGWYDEIGGDVDSPFGWYGRAGKWIITADGNGFVYGRKQRSEDAAKRIIDNLEEQYGKWYDDAE